MRFFSRFGWPLINVTMCLLAGAPQAAAQPDTAWVRRYDGGGPSQDDLYGLAIDHETNVYVTGRVSTVFTGFDIATIKYSPAGDTLWVRRYDGPASGSDAGTDLAVDDGGNAYVTGYCLVDTVIGEDTIYHYDFLTLKYAPSGDLIWERRYDGPAHGDDYGRALAIDSAGFVYVTGYSYTDGVTRDDYLTIKYSPAGDTVWVRRFTDPNQDIPADLALGASGQVSVTGAGNRGMLIGECLTVLYDAAGNELWARRYASPVDGGAWAAGVAIDDSGNVYVAGTSWEGGSPGGDGPLDDYVTIKYTPLGDTVWVRRYNGPVDDFDVVEALVLDRDGNPVVTGESAGGSAVDGPPTWDYATVKYSKAGDELWAQRYSYSDTDGVRRTDMATALAVDAHNDIYVTGWSQGIPITKGGPGLDCATLKYSAEGNHLWTARYDGPDSRDDEAFRIAVDVSGNVYVAGFSVGASTNLDFAIIKYRSCPIDLSGDVSGDDVTNSQDIIALVTYVFLGGAEPFPCAAVGDANCDGEVTASDIIGLVNYIFKSGAPPCAVCPLIPETWACP